MSDFGRAVAIVATVTISTALVVYYFLSDENEELSPTVSIPSALRQTSNSIQRRDRDPSESFVSVFRCIFVGPAGAGKSSIIQRWLHDRFDEFSHPTRTPAGESKTVPSSYVKNCPHFSTRVENQRPTTSTSRSNMGYP